MLQAKKINEINCRQYGSPPHSIVLIHGGPGAAGEMAPLARILSDSLGILEPLQTASTIYRQIAELKNVLGKNSTQPVTLIGYSWGAWLSFIFAAEYPLLAKKLILISSGPFEEKYAVAIQQTRLNRLAEDERKEVENLLKILEKTDTKLKNRLLARLGFLFAKADAYDPIFHQPDESAVQIQFDIYKSVWAEAAEFRRSGRLLNYGQHITCQVIAIHGDYDPHPAAGVERPLSAVLKNFRFILLNDCGHKPWVEKYA